MVIFPRSFEEDHLGRIPCVILDHEFRLTLASRAGIELDRDGADRADRKPRATGGATRLNRKIASALNRDAADSGGSVVPPWIEQECLLGLTVLPDST